MRAARALFAMALTGLSACAPALKSSDNGSAQVSFRVRPRSGLGQYLSALSGASSQPFELSDDFCYAVHVTGDEPSLRRVVPSPSNGCAHGPDGLGQINGFFKKGDTAEIDIPVGLRRRVDLIGVPKRALPETLQTCKGVFTLDPEAAANGQILVSVDGVAYPRVRAQVIASALADIQVGANQIDLVAVSDYARGLPYACAGGPNVTLESNVAVSPSHVTARHLYARNFPLKGACSEAGVTVQVKGVGGSIDGTSFGEAACSESRVWTLNADLNDAPNGLVSLEAALKDLAGNAAKSELLTLGKDADLHLAKENALLTSVAVGGALTAVSGNVRVTVRDSVNELVGFTGLVRFKAYTAAGCAESDLLGSGLRSGSGTSGLNVSAMNGQADFTNLNFSVNGSYYLRASTPGGALSDCYGPVAVAAGALADLVFVTQPPSAPTADATFGVSVSLRDSFGNQISGAVNSVTLAVYADQSCGSVSGTPLSGNTVVSASGGLASFTNLARRVVGDYSILARTGALTKCSTGGTVSVGSFDRFSLISIPSSATAGLALSGVTVRAEDAWNNPILAQPSVTLSAYTTSDCSGAATGTLAGTLTQNASSATGRAGFPSVSYSKAETIYLKFTSGSVETCLSNSIVVAAGLATQVVRTNAAPPSSISTDTTLSLTYEARDSLGNVDLTADDELIVSAYSDPACNDPVSGLKAGTYSDFLANGTVSLPGLRFLAIRSNVYLKAHAGSVDGACLGPLNVSAGAPAKLVFATQPPATPEAGIDNLGDPQVLIQDDAGNTLTGADRTISIEARTDTNCASAATFSLQGVLSRSSSGGLAEFTDIRYVNAETVRLRATASNLASACSDEVAVHAAPADRLVFLTSPAPTGLYNRRSMGSFTVEARDSFGNRDTAFNEGVIVSLADPLSKRSVPGLMMAPLIAATNGQATFSAPVAEPGTYILKATKSTAPAIAEAYSASFSLASVCTTSPVGGDTFHGGTGFASDPYVVCTPAQFAAINANAGTRARAYYQGADLDLSTGFTPIGTCAEQFTGQYDGGGYRILNLGFNNASTDCVGLFASIGSGATVQRIRMEGLSIQAGSNVGAVAGINSGEIFDVSVLFLSGATQGVVGAGQYVGGVVGAMDAGCTTNCGLNNVRIARTSSYGIVQGNQRVGGIVGSIDGANPDGGFERWESYLSVAGVGAGAAHVGGLVGYASFGTRPIRYAYFSGQAQSDVRNVGGAIGTLVDGTVSDVFGMGSTVIASNPDGTNFAVVGGFVGELGAASGSHSPVIERCAAVNGTISGNSSDVDAYYVGGFAGRVYGASMIRDARAESSAPIQGYMKVGGFIGAALPVSGQGPTVQRVYAKGQTNAPGGTYGAFIGYDGGNGTYQDSFWDSTVNGNPGTPPSGTSGMSTSSMTNASTFSAWTFGTNGPWMKGASLMPRLAGERTVRMNPVRADNGLYPALDTDYFEINKTDSSGTSGGKVLATRGVSSGKRYWEIEVLNSGDFAFGVSQDATGDLSKYIGETATGGESVGYHSFRAASENSGLPQIGMAGFGIWTPEAVANWKLLRGDVVGISLDLDSAQKILKVTVNGAAVPELDQVIMSGGTYYPVVGRARYSDAPAGGPVASYNFHVRMNFCPTNDSCATLPSGYVGYNYDGP